MTQILRQSTQVVVRIGPFYDVTDGVTPETGVTLAAADQAELLKAAGAATVDISARTFAAIASCDGYYDLTLTTTDTNTIGTAEVVIHDASVHRALPAQRFQVIEEAVYDAIYASGASPATTTDFQASADAAITASATISTIGTNVSDVKLTTVGVMTEDYPTDGSAITMVQALYGVHQLLTNASVSGTTVTVTQRDGTTVAFTLALNSATAPTSIADA